MFLRDISAADTRTAVSGCTSADRHTLLLHAAVPVLTLPWYWHPPLQGSANNPGIFALAEIILCRESKIYCYIGFLPYVPHLLLVFLRLFHRGCVVSVSRSQSPACVPRHEVVEGGRHAVPTPADSCVCFSCNPNGRFPALLRPCSSIAT